MATPEKTPAAAEKNVTREAAPAATAPAIDVEALRAELKAELKAELNAELKAEQASKVAEIGPESEAAHLNTLQLGAMSEELGIPATTVFCDPKKCPPTYVNMFTADDRRIACTSGRVYLFAAGQNLFVHKEDRATCAGLGAAESK